MNDNLIKRFPQLRKHIRISSFVIELSKKSYDVSQYLYENNPTSAWWNIHHEKRMKALKCVVKLSNYCDRLRFRFVTKKFDFFYFISAKSKKSDTQWTHSVSTCISFKRCRCMKYHRMLIIVRWDIFYVEWYVTRIDWVLFASSRRLLLFTPTPFRDKHWQKVERALQHRVSLIMHDDCRGSKSFPRQRNLIKS